MNLKKNVFIVTLFLSVFSLLCNAQTTMEKGKAQLIEFTNETAKFTVPEGKTWIIYNVFSDYCTDIKTDAAGVLTSTNIRIYIKSINNVTKTDLAKMILGTQLYMSKDATKAIGMPIVIPEKTKFELLLVSGDAYKEFKLFSGTGFMSIIETNN